MANVAEIFKSMDYGPAPEGAAPALDWLTERGAGFGHFIDGAFTETGDETFDDVEPGDGCDSGDALSGNRRRHRRKP